MKKLSMKWLAQIHTSGRVGDNFTSKLTLTPKPVFLNTCSGFGIVVFAVEILSSAETGAREHEEDCKELRQGGQG